MADDKFTLEMLDHLVEQARQTAHTKCEYICSRCGAFTNEVIHRCGGPTPDPRSSRPRNRESE